MQTLEQKPDEERDDFIRRVARCVRENLSNNHVYSTGEPLPKFDVRVRNCPLWSIMGVPAVMQLIVYKGPELDNDRRVSMYKPMEKVRTLVRKSFDVYPDDDIISTINSPFGAILYKATHDRKKYIPPKVATFRSWTQHFIRSPTPKHDIFSTDNKEYSGITYHQNIFINFTDEPMIKQYTSQPNLCTLGQLISPEPALKGSRYLCVNLKHASEHASEPASEPERTLKLTLKQLSVAPPMWLTAIAVDETTIYLENIPDWTLFPQIEYRTIRTPVCYLCAGVLCWGAVQLQSGRLLCLICDSQVSARIQDRGLKIEVHKQYVRFSVTWEQALHYEGLGILLTGDQEIKRDLLKNAKILRDFT